MSMSHLDDMRVVYDALFLSRLKKVEEPMSDQLRQEIEEIVSIDYLPIETEKRSFQISELLELIAKHDRELVEQILEDIELHKFAEPDIEGGTLDTNEHLDLIRDRIRAKYLGEKE